MKKTLSLAAFAGLLFISACQKSGRHFRGNTVDDCSISTIILNESNFPDTLTFLYNQRGAPTDAIMTNTGSGNPSYLFHYDLQGRLLDFIGRYDNGAAEFWTRYFYSNDNRTVYDSTYTLVSEYVSWPPPNISGGLRTQIKQYDEQGRVTSIANNFFGNLSTQIFRYDHNGNVIGATYDNKVNFHRTNWVWQFVDDQYSTNNPVSTSQPIAAYNGYGLPTSLPHGPTLFGLGFDDVIIRYSCDIPSPPHSGN